MSTQEVRASLARTAFGESGGDGSRLLRQEVNARVRDSGLASLARATRKSTSDRNSNKKG
jgi:hypothetical protein